jgi:hypothetical protein
MKTSLFFTYIFSVAILMTCCSRKSDKHSNSIIQGLDTFNIAIMQGYPVFDSTYSAINLTEKDLQLIDDLFYNCIKQYNATMPKELHSPYIIDMKMYNYKRQYVAVLNSKGEKEVWINCFCEAEGYEWKNQIMIVADGGNCYFNLKVNLRTKTCYELSVNNEE